MLKTCAECGHKNLDDAKFCEICGSRIGDSLANAEDDVSGEPEMVEEPQIVPEVVEEPQDAPETLEQPEDAPKSWWSRRSSGGKALTLIMVVLSFVLVAGLIWTVTIDANTPLQNQDTGQNTLEVEKNNKMQAIQNSDEFKQAINQFIENNYSGDNPNVKYLAVKDLKGDNEIVVVMDVEYTSDSGEVKTHHYGGTWTKVDGTWQAQSNFNFTTS